MFEFLISQAFEELVKIKKKTNNLVNCVGNQSGGAPSFSVNVCNLSSLGNTFLVPLQSNLVMQYPMILNFSLKI